MRAKKFMLKLMVSTLLFLICVDNYSGTSIKEGVPVGVAMPTVQVAGEVPEPATAILMSLGGVLWHRRYRKKS